MVGMLQGFDAAERLVDSGVELRADGFNGWTLRPRRASSICLTMSSTPVRSWSTSPSDFEGEGEIVEHAEEGLDGDLDGIVANVLALFGFALAGVVELGLEAGEAILRLVELQGELIALVAELLGVGVELLAFGSGFNVCVRIFGLVDVVLFDLFGAHGIFLFAMGVSRPARETIFCLGHGLILSGLVWMRFMGDSGATVAGIYSMQKLGDVAHGVDGALVVHALGAEDGDGASRRRPGRGRR